MKKKNRIAAKALILVKKSPGKLIDENVTNNGVNWRGRRNGVRKPVNNALCINLWTASSRAERERERERERVAVRGRRYDDIRVQGVLFGFHYVPPGILLVSTRLVRCGGELRISNSQPGEKYWVSSWISQMIFRS